MSRCLSWDGMMISWFSSDERSILFCPRCIQSEHSIFGVASDSMVALEQVVESELDSRSNGKDAG